MKKVLKVVAVSLALALPLYAAMSDTSALKKAKATWGLMGDIGQKRNVQDTNWTRLVGYDSPKCVNEFTVVGKGFNTWDAAFADADAHPATVGGPFKGTVTVNLVAWDNEGLAIVEFFVDGNVIAAAKNPNPPVQNLNAAWDIDTTQLANGYHVLCGQATDTGGLVGKSNNGMLFKVDQTLGASNEDWHPGKSGLPVILLGIAQKQ